MYFGVEGVTLSARVTLFTCPYPCCCACSTALLRVKVHRDGARPRLVHYSVNLLLCLASLWHKSKGNVLLSIGFATHFFSVSEGSVVTIFLTNYTNCP